MSTNPPCQGCAGPHPFDTTIESALWNDVIRRAGLPDYLCLTCIVDAFAKAERSFTGDLCGGGFGFVHFEFVFNGRKPEDLQLVAEQNNILRVALRDIGHHANSVLSAVCRPTPTVAPGASGNAEDAM